MSVIKVLMFDLLTWRTTQFALVRAENTNDDTTSPSPECIIKAFPLT